MAYGKTHPFQKASKMQLLMLNVLKGNSALATQDHLLPSKISPVRSKLIRKNENWAGSKAKFWKAINQSCVTSAQFHFSIQLNSEICNIQGRKWRGAGGAIAAPLFGRIEGAAGGGCRITTCSTSCPPPTLKSYWHNFWTNYDLDLFSISKWPSELQSCENYKGNWRKNG